MIGLQPLLLHYLQQLIKLLQKIPAPCFSAALAPDMFSLAEQARIASNYSLRLYCPLLQEVERRRDYLQSLPVVNSLSAERRIQERAGFADLDLTETQFIHHYGLPNFFFHLSMVYAIARQQGVALSKADFDGFHQYPADFSFIDKAEH